MVKFVEYEPDETPLLCACGCGAVMPKARYPSQQRRFINTHQHKGSNNGNYRGGKVQHACAVCGESFMSWPSSAHQVTCGKDACYRTWQGLTTAARGQNKIVVRCDQCGQELRLYPSQVGPVNYCNRFCQSLHRQRLFAGVNNARWQGGAPKYWMEQARRRDNYSCVICGFDLTTDVHHITPVANGGTDTLDNLITLCPNHHRLADTGVINVESYRRTDWTDDLILSKANAAERSITALERRRAHSKAGRERREKAIHANRASH